MISKVIDNYNQLIGINLQEHYDALVQFKEEDFKSKIIESGKLLAKSLKNDGLIMWCGNGGSAADSQHLAAELIGRFKNDRKSLKSIALTTDTSVLTCISNDWSYKKIFSRQLEGLGSAGDVLVVISTSGMSGNIQEVVKSAKEMDIKVIGFLGKGGGILKDVVDYPIIINSDITARIQEMHIFIGHILCEIIETELCLI